MAPPDDFKNALSAWASGVTVVGTRQDDGLMYGLTVSSFTSLSLDPPLILVCLNNGNRMPDMIRRTGKFAVSVLAEGQEEIAKYFAVSGREPSSEFVDTAGVWTANGQPAVRQAAAYVACDLFEQIVQGDHTICIGRAVETKADPQRRPLIYFRRKYRGVTD